MKIRTAVLISTLALPVSLFAAHPAKPGKWEVTTEIDMPGMPAKPAPMTRTVCITQDDLEKNPETTIPKPMNRRTGEERSDCKISDYKVDDKTVTWNLTCQGERNTVTGSGKITYGTDSYDGSMQMKVGDREMKVTYKGKWISSECDKK
ncbi:MAG TPA: DUF3617 domain-containing protein [Thermoanaerobaculia bacterium]|nr:DUF3617 domain-containing protein [Thermoanaerobaculia bacterium]